MAAPFLLVSPRLILLPTPFAISHPKYLALYAELHASPEFCLMGFGPNWPARQWTDTEVQATVRREIEACWKNPNNLAPMGDFAVGLRPDSKSSISAESEDRLKIIESEEYARLVGPDVMDSIQWCGYAGVRDPSQRLPAPPAGQSLPLWRECERFDWEILWRRLNSLKKVTEVRYGFAPAFWGRGFATEAAQAVMAWARMEHGVIKFVAETERDNVGSAKVLRKAEFVETGTNYWQDSDLIEWVAERR